MDPSKRAELVERRDRLRSERVLCKHGVTQKPYGEGGGCAGTIGRCGCCSQSFCFADSGSFDNRTGMHYISSWTRDLCHDCGGRYVDSIEMRPEWMT